MKKYLGFFGLFSALIANASGSSYENRILIRIPGSKKKKGGGIKRFRSKPIRNEDEAHLYGNKLARKAYRGVMTLQCARK